MIMVNIVQINGPVHGPRVSRRNYPQKLIMITAYSSINVSLINMSLTLVICSKFVMEAFQ